MGAIADKKLGDFLPTIDAYRPVALAVAAILGLVVVLPGATGGDGGSPVSDFASTPAAAEDGVSSDAPPTTGGATRGGSDDADVPTTGPVGSPVALPATAPRAAVPLPSARSSSPPPSPDPGGAADAPRPPAGGAVSGGSGSLDSDPLQIVASGWASSTGGSPVPTAEAENVPEGTLPVGTRLGQTDKVSFVRLSGEGSALVLAEDAAGRRGRSFEAPPVQLCAISEGTWEAGEAQPMSEAPQHDPDSCVPAQQRPDGTWAFNLSVFPDPADERGFALVPAADAPIDFQITFAAQAVT